MKVLRVELTREAWRLVMTTAYGLDLVAFAVGIPVGNPARHWCEFKFLEWDRILFELETLTDPYKLALSLDVWHHVSKALDTVGAAR